MIIMFHYVRTALSFNVAVNNFYDFEIFKSNIKQLLDNNKNFIDPSILSKEDWIYLSKDPNSIILTFDDGYLDHSQLVSPFLDTLDIKGLFFIPSKMLTERKVLDVNKIHILLNIYKGREKYLFKKVIEFLVSQKSYNPNAISNIKLKYLRSGKYDSKYINFFKRVCQLVFKSNDLDEFSNIVLNIPNLNSRSLANDLYLDLYDFNSMFKNGHSLGLHGHEHLYLSRLNLIEQASDINKSIDIFEKQSIKSKYLFAFPYGDYNKNTLKICNDLDISVAFIDNMHNTSIQYPHLTIPRIDCNDYFQKHTSIL